MAYTFELEMTVIGRHALGLHETCVHGTFGTVKSIFITQWTPVQFNSTVFLKEHLNIKHG